MNQKELIVTEWYKHLYGDDMPVADEGDVDFEYFTKWLDKKLITLEQEAEKRGYAEGKAYWEPAEVHKEVWRQEGYELAKKHFKQIEEEAHDRGAMEATTVCNEVLQKARREVLEEVRKEIACSECNGSGARSTPSDYSPCNWCNGSGFNLDGCFNDHFDSLTK